MSETIAQCEKGLNVIHLKLPKKSLVRLHSFINIFIFSSCFMLSRVAMHTEQH